MKRANAFIVSFIFFLCSCAVNSDTESAANDDSQDAADGFESPHQYFVDVKKDQYDLGIVPLFKAKPVVENQNLPSYVLANDNLNLFKIRIGSETTLKPVGIRQYGLEFEKIGDFGIDSLYVERGSVTLDSSAYQIVTCTLPSANLECYESWGIPQEMTKGVTYISFSGNEEIVSGIGSIYTLRGRVYESSTGDSIVFKMQPAPLSNDLTVPPKSEIVRWVFGQFFIAKPDIPIDDLRSLPWLDAGANFIWSDLSQNPHDAGEVDIAEVTSSNDFRNDFLVPGIEDATSVLVSP